MKDELTTDQDAESQPASCESREYLTAPRFSLRDLRELLAATAGTGTRDIPLAEAHRAVARARDEVFGIEGTMGGANWDAVLATLKHYVSEMENGRWPFPRPTPASPPARRTHVPGAVF